MLYLNSFYKLMRDGEVTIITPLKSPNTIEPTFVKTHITRCGSITNYLPEVLFGEISDNTRTMRAHAKKIEMCLDPKTNLNRIVMALGSLTSLLWIIWQAIHETNGNLIHDLMQILQGLIPLGISLLLKLILKFLLKFFIKSYLK